MPKVLNRALDHLEEWIIATLIAAATALIFFAVLHRYGTGLSIDLSKWTAARGIPVLPAVFKDIFLWLAVLSFVSINRSCRCDSTRFWKWQEGVDEWFKSRQVDHDDYGETKLWRIA